MFKYKVHVFDDMTDKFEDETGLVAADGYAEAIDKVIDYYGASNLVGVYLEKWDDIFSGDEIIDGLTTG
jgi:hypothetical protein